jgi:hypothetical protein
VSDEELGYVQGLLDSAHEIEPRVVDEPAIEARSFAMRAGAVRLRYVGYNVVPDAAEPLFDALDDIAETHCALITP